MCGMVQCRLKAGFASSSTGRLLGQECYSKNSNLVAVHALMGNTLAELMLGGMNTGRIDAGKTYA